MKIMTSTTGRTLGRTILGITALVAIGGVFTPRAHAQLPTTNLLINPGAETGNLIGWTVGGDSNPGVDDGSFDGFTPHTGNFDFYGNNGLSGTLTQNVALVGTQGITAALIDTGTLSANVGFWEQGLAQGDPSDNAQVTLTFRNGAAAALGSVSTPIIDSHNQTWQSFLGSFGIPVGTRTIDYTMVFLRNSGSDNDSFIDDNSLTVSAVPIATAAPEPGSLALLALGGLPFLGRRLRLRSQK